MLTATEEKSPIDLLLAEQSTLRTPVALFSEQEHRAKPDQARFYKQLIPLSKPGAGEQYGFQVDLDKCTGCKACVSACHSLNGLEENETWRDVGIIQGGTPAAPYQQTVTTACHHCEDPACLNGCPVLAYEKDPDTGIVRHLDDQCIGCQYCVLKCPYDVPKFSKTLGIVRKCDMCHGRLAVGEAPACVQACPTEAIRITIVATRDTEHAASEVQDFLPSAPSPDYTGPTTRYVTKREIPENVRAGDHAVLRPEPAHFPLVVMLTLTQLSVGLYTASLFSGAERAGVVTNLLAFVFLLAGLAASTAHLGRPLGAWRAFLGLRRSWLSREIVGFGLFMGIATAYTFAPFKEAVPDLAIQTLGIINAAIGLTCVFFSVMIYHDTRREAWRFPISGGKFFGTTFGLGLAGLTAVCAILDQGPALKPIAFIVIGLFATKLACEALRLRAVFDDEFEARKKSALLQVKSLRAWTLARFASGALGMILFLFLISPPASPPTPLLAVAGFAFLTIGEFLERVLYFKAVVALKMPGSF